MSETLVALNIGGEQRAGATTFERLNPITNMLATRTTAAHANDAIAAAEAAAKAFPDWVGSGPNIRRCDDERDRRYRGLGAIPDPFRHLPYHDPTVHDEAQMPFGGVKASGHGRFGGKAGIDQFFELRWVTIETEPGHYPN